MSTTTLLGPAVQPPIPPLEDGDRLSRDEFERRYHAMPRHVKAELIEGVVYMASPLRFENHSRPDHRLAGWLFNYLAATPGVDSGVNGTVRLDEESEPQPDTFLFILPEYGGQARISADDYIEGAPELMIEIAASTTTAALGPKRRAYAAAGVREYLVWRVRDDAIDWFVLKDGAFVPHPPADDGSLKSTVFPGLWLDPAAALRRDSAGIIAALNRGLASPEHAAFVAALQARHTPPT
jgi:Uma2 family endonuclease